MTRRILPVQTNQWFLFFSSMFPIKQTVDKGVREEMIDFIEFYVVEDTSVGVNSGFLNARRAQGT